VVSSNAGDGIVLGDGSGVPDAQIGQMPGLLVTGNTTNGNSYDGINVDPVVPSKRYSQGMDVTLTANTGNNNGHLRIDSPCSSVGPPPVTVIDGGENMARGNDDKAQCANVV
jgi:hypothetical protein